LEAVLISIAICCTLAHTVPCDLTGLATEASKIEASILHHSEAPQAARAHDHSTSAKTLKKMLDEELSKRPHNHYNGVAPFRKDLRHEYQRSTNLHFTRSQFCSGERQQILKYILEHPDGGLDLVDSATTDYSHQNRQFKKAHVEKVINDSMQWAGTVDDEMGAADVSEGDGIDDAAANRSNEEQIQKRTRYAMRYMAESTLADEVRDKGFMDNTKEHIKWEKTRITQLLKMSSSELRHRTRTWPVIEECFPLHDKYELDKLVAGWATGNVFASAWKKFRKPKTPLELNPQLSMQEAAHDEAAMLHVRGVLSRSETEVKNLLSDCSHIENMYHAVVQMTIRKRYDAATGEDTSWGLATMVSADAANGVLSHNLELPEPMSVAPHNMKQVTKGSQSGDIMKEAQEKMMVPSLLDFKDMHEAFSAQPIEEVSQPSRHSFSAPASPLSGAAWLHYLLIRLSHPCLALSDQGLFRRADSSVLCLYRTLHEVTVLSSGVRTDHVHRPDAEWHREQPADVLLFDFPCVLVAGLHDPVEPATERISVPLGNGDALHLREGSARIRATGEESARRRNRVLS
jgi:hypothetical protein